MWHSELRRADRLIGSIVRDNLVSGFMPPPAWRSPGPSMDLRPQSPGGGADRMAELTPHHEGPSRLPQWQGPSPWKKPPRMPMNDRDFPTSMTIFLFKDLTKHHEIRSENWPASISENDLTQSAGASAKFRTLFAKGRLWRVGYGSNSERLAIFGFDLEPSVTILKKVATAFLLTIPVALLLIAFGAIYMARGALRPVHNLTHLVERITARGLGERIDSPVNNAEFEKLILVFNEMMDRLERSFLQANRFSADAAHELRTPISILQGYVERMLRVVEPGSTMQQDLGEMVDEIHRIKSILEKLLLLVRLDAGQVQLRLSPVDLSGIVKNIIEDVQALDPDIHVEGSIEPDLQVDADSALLETAIQNLSSNAVKYNKDKNGRIRVELCQDQASVILTISNTGPRISEADREKIFERFYRADQSRSREIDGLGLGLSLAREIVQAHHGKLELVNGVVEMNCFKITLPHGHASQNGYERE